MPEDRGPFGIPSAAPLTGPMDNDTEQPKSEVPALTEKGVLFVEFFAGSANLTEAVANLGVDVASPNDLSLGGADFRKSYEVEGLKQQLAELHQAGRQLMIHLAPPCSTFSRARDRSRKRG